VSSRRLRLVTFDLDDTLWDVRPVLASAESRVAEWLDANCPEVAARLDRGALAARRLHLLGQRPELRHHISELRREAMRLALLECGYAPPQAESLAAQAFEVFHAARHEVEPFAAVDTCLADLARSYMLGVITNGNADVFRLPLGRHFRFAVRAESVGASKPDAAHFQAALRLAGVAAAEALHVGDHPDHDIAGAMQAGLRAVWFNPQANPWPAASAAPEGEFREFSGLPALLRRLGDSDPVTG
jgi:FMN hydrolase / 5-amino-6-(5-phospho-D-ribitylamino)uracil phosphatase